MSEIHNLLCATVRHCRGSISTDVLNFLEETVKAVVDDNSIMNEEEIMTMLLGWFGQCDFFFNFLKVIVPSDVAHHADAGLAEIDEEDLQELATTISLMTRGDKGQDENESGVNDLDDDGTCELCERYIRRTFHHLIPKETHNRYLKKKKLPANIKAVAKEIGVDPSMSRAWLNTYGTMICGACHRAVHNAVTNEDLAENYNTVDLLLEHDKIFAFVKYNSKQPVRKGLYF